MKNLGRKYVLFFIIVITVIFIGRISFLSYSQSKKTERTKIEETKHFNRPAPTRPIRPEIPNANRYQQDKVFLEYADSLYRLKSNDTTFRQILKGNVKFRQAGMWMYCDSAYYYPNLNSLDAFGNVRMEQGDTLFVYADKLFYNGNQRLAKLKNGVSEPKVRLVNRDVTLTTDSLDYSIAEEVGWYLNWGIIDDKTNTLTSEIGYYHPDSKNAEFYKDVVLVNNKDGYTLLTDTLYYNTRTHIANVVSLSTIQSENDTIITTGATYYSDLGNAEMTRRSTLIHRDSTGNIVTLEGDSIIYDKATRISRAYMFEDKYKRSQPMVLTDTAQKTTLIGGFGIYNDATREAMAYIYPLLMEYSTGDTLFLRADTIKTFVTTEWVNEVRKKIVDKSPVINGKPLVVIEEGKFYLDTIFFNRNLPWENMPLLMLKERVGKEKDSSNNVSEDIYNFSDEPIDIKELPEGTEIQIIEPPEEYLQDVPDIEIVESDIIINVPEESNPSESSTSLNNKFQGNEKTEEINILPGILEEVDDINVAESQPELPDTTGKVPKDFHVALAYHNGRFFKKDIQGVGDSLVFVERDSMLYMFRKPVVWSGERQVNGNRIDVHFNDSTADWARLPESGLMAEFIEEDFYNQITGRDLYAIFENETLKTLEVSGNVETIFLPQEEDSTYTRLIQAESSYLFLELDSNKLVKLKMWPEVNGTVIPLFLVKNSQKYLRNFEWLDYLRPQREWYGGQVVWADGLGEVPEFLEAYFKSPSVFGEPKSFTGPRIEIPKSTLMDYDMAEAETDESDESDKSDEDSSSHNPDETIMTSEGLKESEEQMNQEEEKALEEDKEIENIVEKSPVIMNETPTSDDNIIESAFEEDPEEEELKDKEENIETTEREEPDLNLNENEDEEEEIGPTIVSIDDDPEEEITIEAVEEPEVE